ncbi:preprotein translocase subunit SecE [uncultured Ruminococcus sp.]|uniref:preprotein translocase subunit SecE n=1 Tax=uncultured Ruminococcus sp. TaxID=165186 RepID=UPI0025FB0938|nr:preprotein translocase subunit SecE [uncultured Ruminococcus sp.]
MAKDKEITKSSKKDAKIKGAEKAKKKGGIRRYFRDLKAEIKKVVWPTKSQVINNTGVVLSVMVVMAIFLFAVDTGLGKAIQALLSIGS